MDRQSVFDNYINEYIKLPYELKESELVAKQKEIIDSLLQYYLANNMTPVILKSKEINDVLSNNPIHEDYVEANMIYSEQIAELLYKIIEK